MRLIDADALKIDIACVYGSNPKYLNWLNHAPTIDAVPVIRCKECKYYQQSRNADEWLWCMMNHHYTDEEKYCGWAERKEE